MQLADQVQSTLATAGQKVATVTLQVASYEALQNLIYGFISIILAATFAVLSVKFTKKIMLRIRANEYGDEEFWFLPLVLLGYFPTLLFIAVSGKLLYIYNWVGLSHPDIYLAHQIMSKFLDN